MRKNTLYHLEKFCQSPVEVNDQLRGVRSAGRDFKPRLFTGRRKRAADGVNNVCFDFFSTVSFQICPQMACQHSHTGCNYLTFLHCVILGRDYLRAAETMVRWAHLATMPALIFIHCVFLIFSLNGLPQTPSERMYMI